LIRLTTVSVDEVSHRARLIAPPGPLCAALTRPLVQHRAGSVSAAEPDRTLVETVVDGEQVSNDAATCMASRFMFSTGDKGPCIAYWE